MEKAHREEILTPVSEQSLKGFLIFLQNILSKLLSPFNLRMTRYTRVSFSIASSQSHQPRNFSVVMDLSQSPWIKHVIAKNVYLLLL